MFLEPVRPIFIDTRIASRNGGWLADLHARLHAIDPWYASLVDRCIWY